MADIHGLRTSSRLAPGLPPQSGAADSTRSSSKADTPYLPSELKAHVARFLVKSDLKSLRHVSKQWHAMATPLLFDKVYVSPRKKDIQIFSHITNHPLLRLSVKELVCDVSKIPNFSLGGYFIHLHAMWGYLTSALRMEHPFNGPHSGFNRFINAIIRYQIFPQGYFSSSANDYIIEGYLSRFANEDYIIEGFQRWQELAAEERGALKGGLHGTYYSDLCSGLHRLPNLQSVKIDNEMWHKIGMVISETFDMDHFNHIPSAVLSGSPLARSWVPWQLHPKTSIETASKHLTLVMQALSRTKTRIKQFETCSGKYEGFSPMAFAGFGVADRIPLHVATDFRYLQRLELQFTPLRHDNIDHVDPEALGFLPHLLEQLTSLRILSLVLVSVQRMRETRRVVEIPLEATCYSYSQVFPRHGKWESLERLNLRGLAIDGLDMILLFLHQMPRLRNLLLRYMDLLGGTWQGVVEALRYRGASIPWALLDFQGSFRHESGQWWPCTSDVDAELVALKDPAAYARYGGHHPSLPPDADDRLSVNYFNEMFFAAGRERVQAHWHHVQEIENK